MSKKIRLGLRELNIHLKLQKARNIAACMVNNVYFPGQDPALFEIREVADTLEDKYQEVKNERRLVQERTAELYDIEKELDKKLTILAAYVESRAKGNIDIIQSAGMEVRADALPLGIPSKINITSVKETDTLGELKLFWEKVKGAKIYNIEFTENIKDESKWKLYDSTTKSKEIINNLKSGTKYWFRVQAIGSAGKGPFSDPVFKFAP
jgi:hypothetical protein